MKLGVFMLWTEMRTPQGGLQAASEAGAEALSAVGMGKPFAHDDVLPESLRIESAVAQLPSRATSGAKPSKKASKLAESRKLADAGQLAKVIRAVRAKRATAPKPAARPLESRRVGAGRGAASGKLAAAR